MDTVTLTREGDFVGEIRYNNDKRYDVYQTFKWTRTQPNGLRVCDTPYYVKTFDTYTEARAHFDNLRWN